MRRRWRASDALIRERLEPLLERAARGEFASWAASPKRRLALIMLLDQVPRNAYRGTAAAFAFDREALALDRRRHAARGRCGARSASSASSSIYRWSTPSRWRRRMPRSRPSRGWSARRRTNLREYCEYCGRFARKHRDIIVKFGRFPHRNRVLERESTAAEREWLAAGGDNFGQ